MPYIKQEDRKRFEQWKITDIVHLVDCAGDLNYLLTSFIHEYIKIEGESYATYNEVIGVLECAKMELYRRKISIYEDEKIKENGDV